VKHSLIILIALAAAASLAAGAFASSSSTGSAATVSTDKSSLGRILVDGKGRTLYLFEKDRRGRSACSGTCATYWPPLLTHGKPTAGGGSGHR
jgi:predicted lipoprotein with Yx(FWY)xxD motif